MNIKQSTAASYAGHREFMILAMLLTPMLLMVGLFVSGIVMEIRAESDVERLLLQRKRDGLATSRHDSTTAFDQRTSRDNADRWRDVLLNSGELESRYFLGRQVGDHDDGLVGPGEPWEAGPILVQYADEAAPTIALVEQLVKDSNPFWRPLLVDGIGTLLPDLQNSRNILRMLMVEFRVAVHEGDHDRALRTLRLILDVVDAFDWDFSLVGEFVRMAIVGQHRSMIQQSLTIGFWEDAEHLSEIRERLSRHDHLDERAKKVANADIAMVLSELFGDLETDQPQSSRKGDFGKLVPFGASSAVKLQFLKLLHDRDDFSDIGTNRNLQRINREEKRREEKRGNDSWSGSNASLLVAIPYGLGGFLANQFWFSERALARSISKSEFDRKITLTAVAIKQFQVEQDRWPEELNELAAVGLSASQWSVEPGVPIGYRISADESTADLWAAANTSWIVAVPAEPTTEKGPSVQQIWNVTIK